jgi:hypothetical protein
MGNGTGQGAIDAKKFSEHLRRQWAGADFSVSEIGDAPYRELVSARDGWSFSLSVSSPEDPSNLKARVGVWMRPTGTNGSADLAALRAHYQQKLQQQGRGNRIQNCGLPVGTVFLFWETTAPLAQAVFTEWVRMVEELAALAFAAEELDELLES